jgi:hypothetical protein
LGGFHPDYAYFSDTILLWHRWDLFFLPDFVKACAEMICEGLENQIPLRGAISVGVAEMESKKRIYFGLPLIEAVETERAQRWVGVSLGVSVARALSGLIPADAFEGLMPYRSHVKPGFEDRVPGLVVDWPRNWRARRKKDAVEILNGMDVDARFNEYYRQTRDFVTYSKEHADWNRELLRKPQAGPSANPDLSVGGRGT